MNITLTRPNYNSHLITPPLGIGYISSYLRQHNNEIKIIDGLNKGYTNKEIVKRSESAEIVGIFCLSDYFLQTIDLSKKLKERGFKIAIGGPHASTLPRLTLEKTEADYVIVGEGEQTFLELIQNKKKNIPGLITKNTKKFIRRPLIQNLDFLPFPDWEQLDPRKYKKAPHGAFIKQFPVAPIITTRGCPFNCTFCASPKIWGQKIRFRSPKNVIEEIKLLTNDFGVKEIHFEDDNLTLRKSHIESICNKIKENKIKISWACPNGVRADTISFNLLKLMKQSGCYYLAFGFESGNQQILDNIKKRTTLETLKIVATMAEQQKIMTQGFFIFGLPGETKETINNTINFAKAVPLSRAQFLLLDIIPGSQLWDDLNFENKVDWSKRSYQEVTWVPKTVDKKTLSNAPSKAFKTFFLRPKQMYSLIKYFKLAQIPFALKRILDFGIIKPKN